METKTRSTSKSSPFGPEGTAQRCKFKVFYSRITFRGYVTHGRIDFLAVHELQRNDLLQNGRAIRSLEMSLDGLTERQAFIRDAVPWGVFQRSGPRQPGLKD